MDPTTLVPGLAEAIRTRILQGRLLEGEPIDPATLAEELGVDSAPLREALRRMEAEGLVHFLPAGPVVAPVTALEVREGFSAGIALGLVMLPQALPRLGPEEFETLRSLARALDHGKADLEDVMAFYTLLLRPAGMPWLMELFRGILLRTIRIFPLTQANRIELQEARPTRLEVVDACASGDVEAAKQAFADYHQVRCAGLMRAVMERNRKE